MNPSNSQPWHAEYVPRVDPDTGVHITQLTSAPLIHEALAWQPQAFSPDSRYCIYSRRAAYDLPRELWLADLATFRLRRITSEPHVKAPAISPDGLWVYYIVEGDHLALKCLSLATFEHEHVLTTDVASAVGDVATIHPAGLSYVTSGMLGSGVGALLRLDLDSRDASVVYSSESVLDPQPQYSPGAPGEVLFQEHHGCRLAVDGHSMAGTSGYGPDLHVLADDGSAVRDVPVGGSDLEMLQGRQVWVGATRRVIAAPLRRQTPDRAFCADSIVAADLTGEREVIATGRPFAHPSASLDGHWWVCDTAQDGDLYVGSMHTRRHALLAHTGASLGAPPCTHPRPAFTPDAASVVFNSDATGVPQLCVAHVPAEMLQRLL